MRIERINENKIKVTVNRDDVKVWNVNLKNFTDNTPEAQDLFWYALRQAEQDVSFSVGKAQLLVETAAIGNDGFVMIISKLQNEADIAEALMHTGKKLKQTDFKICRRPKTTPLMRIYRFKDFDALCQGVAEICELYLGNSKLFKYKNSFYLEITPKDSFGFFEIENILSEFGDKIKKATLMQGILNEHAELMIFENAIDIIIKNFI